MLSEQFERSKYFRNFKKTWINVQLKCFKKYSMNSVFVLTFWENNYKSDNIITRKFVNNFEKCWKYSLASSYLSFPNTNIFIMTEPLGMKKVKTMCSPWFIFKTLSVALLWFPLLNDEYRLHSAVGIDSYFLSRRCRKYGSSLCGVLYFFAQTQTIQGNTVNFHHC